MDSLTPGHRLAGRHIARDRWRWLKMAIVILAGIDIGVWTAVGVTYLIWS